MISNHHLPFWRRLARPAAAANELGWILGGSGEKSLGFLPRKASYPYKHLEEENGDDDDDLITIIMMMSSRRGRGESGEKKKMW